jgi:prepilin-type N-terminal cleavage/methylation domain-containing protein
VDRSPVVPRGEGFTLTEVLVAVLVLSVLASSVGALLGISAQTLRRTRLETTATLLAHGRLEQLRSLPWGFGSAHAPVPGEDVVSDLSGSEPDVGGGGLEPSPAQTLLTDTPGFADHLDAEGRWVARGPTPPARARFTRRWSISRIAGFPDLLLLRVRVVDRRLQVGEVQMWTVRTRTAG